MRIFVDTDPITRNWQLLLLGLFAGLLGQPAAAGEDFPAPPRAQVEWVSSNMIYNSRPTQVRSFKSRLPVDRVLEYYRNLWQDGFRDRPGYMETDTMQPWRIISRITDEHLLTVQVMSQGNDSKGYLSVTPLDSFLDEGEPMGQGFPMMQGSKVVNDIRTPDAGRDGRTLFLSNDFSVNGNANYYRDHYDLRGWKIDMDKAPSAGDQHVLAFSKGRKKVNIVITRNQDRSFVVANSVE